MKSELRYRAADVCATYCGSEYSISVRWDANVQPTRILRAARRIIAFAQNLIAIHDLGDRIAVLWHHEPQTYHLRASLREALKSRDGTYPLIEHFKWHGPEEKPKGNQFFSGGWGTHPLDSDEIPF